MKGIGVVHIAEGFPSSVLLHLAVTPTYTVIQSLGLV
jgi:hypothetical protein